VANGQSKHDNDLKL